MGTDVLRKHFHDDIWIASLENKLHNAHDQNIVISDSRFVNELKLLAKAGAMTVRVKRGPNPEWWNIASDTMIADFDRTMRMKDFNIHHSEWDWANYKFDVVISNDKSLLDLALQVDHLLT
jgi:hypothetical protein